ncbi:MAG: BspA family leucine-rich repeat surface protein [bacterium]|nr:BspA family leucine-rich repeat surface protein [bacterium]
MLSTISVNAAVKPKKMKLNYSSTTTYVGGKVQLKVKTVSPTKASKAVVWKTSNKKIAVVDKKGKVTGKKNGTVTITATSKANKKVNAKCKVRVYQATKELQLHSSDHVYVIKGHTMSIDAEVLTPVKGAQPLQYSVKNKKIATVSKKGVIKGVKEGTTIVTVKSGAKSKKIEVVVVKEKFDYSYNHNVIETQCKDSDIVPVVDNSGNVSLTVPATTETKNVKKGDIITIASKEAGRDLVFKVCENDTQSGMLEIAVPDSIEDVYDDFYFAGTALPGIKSIKPADGVTINSIEYIGENESNTAQIQSFIDPSFGVTAEEGQGITIDGKVKISQTASIDFTCQFLPASLVYSSKKKQVSVTVPYEITLKGGADIEKEKYLKLFEDVIFDFKTIISMQASIGFKVSGDATVGFDESVGGNLGFTVDGKRKTINNNCTLHPSTISKLTIDGDIKVGPYFRFEFYSFKEEIELFKKALAIFTKNKNYSDTKCLFFTETYGYFEGEAKRKVNALNCTDIIIQFKLEFSVGSDAIDWIPDFTFPVSPKPLLERHYENQKMVKKCNLNQLGELVIAVKDENGLGISGATVKIISNATRKTTTEEIPIGGKEYILEKGTYKITVSKLGYKTNESTVTIPGGKSVTPNIRLIKDVKEEKGTLRFSLKDSDGKAINDATVRIVSSDNKTNMTKVPNASDNSITLLSGTYTITITKAGYKTHNELITIVGGESKSIEIKLLKDEKASYGTLKFNFVDDDGNAIDEVTVIITSKDNQTSQTKKLTALENSITVLTGEYTISISREGYKTVTKNVAVTKDSIQEVKETLVLGMPEQADSIEENLAIQGDHGKLLDSGTCDGYEYFIYEDGWLILTGKAEYAAYNWTTDNYPWMSLDSGIRNCYIDVSGLKSMNNFFRDQKKLENIYFGSNFETSQVEDMSGTFCYCESLKSIDFSKFDTSNVIDMNEMFAGCKKLKSLDLSSFNTSKVEYMNDMFSGCDNLSNLNVSRFDTSNVISMEAMFNGCRSLANLDIRSFDTSKVCNMRWMFSGCRSLRSIDVTGFRTSELWDMVGMFQNCSALTSVDLSSFDTSKVDTMAYMFAKCTSLTRLDLSGFNVENVRYFNNMFEGATSLTSLTISDTFQVKGYYSAMFKNCPLAEQYGEEGEKLRG